MTTYCEIETQRLILRPLCEEDLEAFHRLQSDPQVARFTKQGPNKTVEKSQQMLDDCLIQMNSSCLKEPVLILAIRIKATGQRQDLIGMVGTFRPREIGFSLHPSFWGQGYAQEAAEAFCKWFRAGFPDQRLFAKINTENLASLRVCRKINFTPATAKEVLADENFQSDPTRETWILR